MAGINFRSIRNRLILGYGSMALLLVIVVAITLMQIGKIMLYGFEVLEVKQPSRLYLLEINSGVRHSNSILQTYLLTGDEAFRDQISSIWEKEIDAARDSVDALKVDWVNPENFIEFEKLNRLLSRIKNKQEEIASSASFGGGAVNINLYNYSALSGDTIIGVDNLQTWINSAISDASAQAPDNGSLYNDGLVELSNQVNLIVSTLYTNFYDESLEIRDKIFAERAQFIVVESIIVIGSILLCFLLFRFVLRKINQSVGVLKGEVNTLSAGNIPHERKETGDELDAVLEEIDILSQNLADVKSFALEVGKGNFDNDITVFNNEGEIGNSLAEMRESLKKVSEDARVRNWSNKGFAELGDLLRRHSNDLSELSDQVITFLVNYVEANQGSLFIVEEGDGGDKVLKLKSTYAYDRKKFIEKTLDLGQGLAGQAFLEKESIYLREVPDNYVTITSGLGKATPNAIFILPLIVNGQVFGVIELGSFKDFDEHTRDFIENVGENIASSIQSVKINERTTNLLEESQQMTEEMRAQEEEMRQNMEELQATQEEMERSQRENKQRLEAIENSRMCFIEFDPKGYILNADDSFLKLFEYNSLEEIKGKHHRIFVTPEYAQTEEYQEFWNRLGSGENISGEFTRITKSGKKVHINGAYSVLKDSNGQVYRVMKFATDLTELKNKLETYQSEKESLLKSLEEVKAGLENTSDNPKLPKKELQKLKDDLLEKLRKNESALRASLAQQKKDLNL